MTDDTYFCFQQGNYYYAVDSYLIFKIIKATEINQLPIKEEWIKGVILVDEKIAVIMEVDAHHDGDYFVILNINEQYFGISADKIIGEIKIPDFEWVAQEDLKFPFYYDNEKIRIYHLNLELLTKGKGT